MQNCLWFRYSCLVLVFFALTPVVVILSVPAPPVCSVLVRRFCSHFWNVPIYPSKVISPILVRSFCSPFHFLFIRQIKFYLTDAISEKKIKEHR